MIKSYLPYLKLITASILKTIYCHYVASDNIFLILAELSLSVK